MNLQYLFVSEHRDRLSSVSVQSDNQLLCSSFTSCFFKSWLLPVYPPACGHPRLGVSDGAGGFLLTQEVSICTGLLWHLCTGAALEKLSPPFHRCETAC